MRPFTYERASDAATAITAMGRTSGQHTAFLAGGTTLLDLMKLDVMRPGQIVDISGLTAQHGGIDASNGLRIGALAKMAEVASHPVVRRRYPVIADSLDLAASPQIRNMATIGGNVLQRTRCGYFRDTAWTACNKRNPGSGCAALNGVNRKHAVLGASEQCIATYAGDLAQALIALDTMVDVIGPKGARTFTFADLHRLPGTTPEVETSLAPGELIVGFSVPATAFAARSVYLKIRDRQSYEFALASAAVALDVEDGRVKEARLALGGVATRPWRAREAETALKGKILDEKTADAAAVIAFAGAKTHGGNDYKPDLGRRTLTRALLHAASMRV
jgi:xanthine dehydrogenase YagS FAD-binding subunit